MKSYIVYLFIFIYSIVLFAQTPPSGTGSNVQAGTQNISVDSSKVILGGTFQVQYEIKAIPAERTVQFPDYLAMKADKNFEFVRQHIDTNRQQNGNIDYIQQVQFIALEAGEWKIPSFNFISDQDTIKSEEITVKVEALKIEDPKKMADIQSIHELNKTWKDYFWQIFSWLKDHPMLAFVLLLLILSLIVYLIWKKYRAHLAAKRNQDIPKIVIPPDIEAFELLQALEQKQLWQQGNYKLYYTELSFVLRNYLQRKYLIPALEETTNKILVHLKRTHFPHEQKESLRQLLSLSDLVKFAKEEPQASENIAALEDVRLFLTITNDGSTNE